MSKQRVSVKDAKKMLRPKDRKKLAGIVKAVMKSKKKGKSANLSMKGNRKR